jgi:hypothetical protein
LGGSYAVGGTRLAAKPFARFEHSGPVQKRAQYKFVISSTLKFQLLSEVQVPHQAERRHLAGYADIRTSELCLK